MKALQLYKQVLQIPGTVSLLILSLLARMTNIPFGALVTATAYTLTGSWVIAGICGGISTGGQALSTWVGGFLMDSFGIRKVLWITTPTSLLFIGMFFAHESIFVVAWAGVAGLLRPPIGTSLRSCWQRLAPEEPLRSAAYALDATLFPLGGAAGAVIGGLLLLLSPLAVLLFISIGTIIAGFGLIKHPSTDKLVNRDFIKQDEAILEDIKEFISREKIKKVPLPREAWLAVASGAGIMMATVGAEMALGVAYGPTALAWGNGTVTLAIAAGATMFAGTDQSKSALAYSRVGILMAVVALIIITLLIPVALLLALAVFLILGWGKGLIAASSVAAISKTAPKERMSEAMGLYGSGVLLGQAFYRPIAGILTIPFLIPLIPAGALLWLWFLSRAKESVDIPDI